MNTSLAPDPRTLNGQFYKPFFEKVPDTDNVQREVKHCSYYSFTIGLLGGGDSTEKHWKEEAPYLPDMYIIGIRPKHPIAVIVHSDPCFVTASPETPPEASFRKEEINLDIWSKTIRFSTHPEFWKEERVEKGDSVGFVSKYESWKTWRVNVEKLLVTTQMQLAKWGFPMDREDLAKFMFRHGGR